MNDACPVAAAYWAPGVQDTEHAMGLLFMAAPCQRPGQQVHAGKLGRRAKLPYPTFGLPPHLGTLMDTALVGVFGVSALAPCPGILLLISSAWHLFAPPLSELYCATMPALASNASAACCCRSHSACRTGVGGHSPPLDKPHQCKCGSRKKRVHLPSKCRMKPGHVSARQAGPFQCLPVTLSVRQQTAL